MASPPLLLYLPRPPQTQKQTHSPLFLYSCPLMVCMGETKQDQMSLCTDIMWMFCIVLRGEVTAGQATPLLLGLVSASPVSWVSAAKPSGFSGIFLHILKADSCMQAWLLLWQRTSGYHMGLVRNSNQIT